MGAAGDGEMTAAIVGATGTTSATDAMAPRSGTREVANANETVIGAIETGITGTIFEGEDDRLPGVHVRLHQDGTFVIAIHL